MQINSPLQSNYIKKKVGFTIVEAFTAITVLGLCAVALFTSLQFGFNIVNDIRESIIASTILQEEMEELRRSSFANLPPYGTSPFYNGSLFLLHNSSGTIRVGQYIDTNIVRVTITVSWYSRLKTNKQNVKRVVTLITRNGINSI